MTDRRPKELGEDEIANLLEDRKNGMGLQKTAKKYGIGVPRVRKIEAENGKEAQTPLEAFPTEGQVTPEEQRKHFQEVQDSFAIVMDDIDALKMFVAKNKEMLMSMTDVIRQGFQTEEEIEDMQEEAMNDLIEESKEPKTSKELYEWLPITASIVAIGMSLYALRKGQPKRYEAIYVPPRHYEEPKEPSKKKPKILDME